MKFERWKYFYVGSIEFDAAYNLRSIQEIDNEWLKAAEQYCVPLESWTRVHGNHEIDSVRPKYAVNSWSQVVNG